MKRYILAFLFFLSSLGMAYAAHDLQAPGHKMQLYAFCEADGDKPNKSMAAIKGAIVANSDRTYTDVMQKPGTGCFDVRLMSRSPIWMELVKLEETFYTETKLCVALWRVRLFASKPEEIYAYSWIQCKEDK